MIVATGITARCIRFENSIDQSTRNERFFFQLSSPTYMRVKNLFLADNQFRNMFEHMNILFMAEFSPRMGISMRKRDY